MAEQKSLPGRVVISGNSAGPQKPPEPEIIDAEFTVKEQPQASGSTAPAVEDPAQKKRAERKKPDPDEKSYAQNKRVARKVIDASSRLRPTRSVLPPQPPANPKSWFSLLLEGFQRWIDDNAVPLSIAFVLLIIGMVLHIRLPYPVNQWALLPFLLVSLMPLGIKEITSTPPQRGVRKTWQRYHGRELLPGYYLTIPLLYGLKILKSEFFREPEKPQENPLFEFDSIGCNRFGLNQNDLRPPDADKILDLACLGNIVRREQWLYQISGAVKVKVYFAIRPDGRSWADVASKGIVPPPDVRSLKEPRFIQFLTKFSEKPEELLSSVEDQVGQWLANIGRLCRWQTIYSSPEIAMLLLTEYFTNEVPYIGESTAEFIARMAREGFSDKLGFGGQVFELAVEVEPDPTLKQQVDRIATSEQDRVVRVYDAETMKMLVEQYRQAWPDLDDEELKDMVLSVEGDAQQSIYVYRGIPQGTTMFNVTHPQDKPGKPGKK